MSTDVEAVVYLMLMNTMIHDYFPTAITIGEDVSGMPTFCRFASLPSALFVYCLSFELMTLKKDIAWDTDYVNDPPSPAHLAKLPS